MPNRLRHFAYALAVVLLAAVSAHAQKPTLTKSVDEPGRTPYFEASAAPCQLVNDSISCLMTFPQVPTGFRLVVTWIEYVYVAATNLPRYAYLGATPSLQSIFLPVAPQLPGSINNFVLSAPVTYYVEPSAVPTITIYDAVAGSYAFGSVTGYLVAIP